MTWMRKSTRTISWINGDQQDEARAFDPLEAAEVKTTARSYSRRMRTDAKHADGDAEDNEEPEIGFKREHGLRSFIS